MNSFSLDGKILLGVSSAATQIEGGGSDNNWYDWYKKGHITDGADPSRANEHYERYEEDLLLMQSMGIKAYRFGIEWSKTEPRRGVFDEEVLKHYRDEIMFMLKLGIKPLLTLHHFENPMWFENMGAFECDECVEIFTEFVGKVIETLGDIVEEYVTINEPNVYAANGLLFGIWPPGKKSFSSVSKAFTNFVRCHIAAYKEIHTLRLQRGFDNTRVGFAMHVRVFDPQNPKSIKHRLAAKISERCFQSAVTEAMANGKCAFPVGRNKDIKNGKYYDFIGINYYTRSTVTSPGDGVKKDVPVNDLGWEIYPEGIVRVCREFYEKYNAEIYITENGTCDNTDSFRARYIYEHIKALAESGLPVTRYYHWCFTDNFEWLEGESARFGLVHIDYKTQKRTVKQSGNFFTEMIANDGVTEEMYEKYCTQCYSYKKSEE